MRKAAAGSAQVPQELLNIASVYLSIIFLGAPFTYFYNAVSAALKSVGDSKTLSNFWPFPLCSTGVLDLIFIGGLGFGIVCSAVTTVIAEAASALLCILYVYRKSPCFSFGGENSPLMEACSKRHELRQHHGPPAVCQPIGKLLIQGAVNPLGVDMIAAFNAVNRIDDYAFTPEQSISHGITTFVAQNRGAGKRERIRAGFRRGLFLEFCYWVCICLTVTFLRRPLMGLFVTEGK